MQKNEKIYWFGNKMGCASMKFQVPFTQLVSLPKQYVVFDSVLTKPVNIEKLRQFIMEFDR